MVDALVPVVVSYVTVEAVPLVLAAKVIGADCVILLLDTKLILPPFDVSVIAPVKLIPVLPPAADNVPVIDKFLPTLIVLLSCTAVATPETRPLIVTEPLAIMGFVKFSTV